MCYVLSKLDLIYMGLFLSQCLFSLYDKHFCVFFFQQVLTCVISHYSYINFRVFSVAKCCYFHLYSPNICQIHIFLCIFSKCFEVVVCEGAGTGLSSSPRGMDTLGNR